MLRQEVDARLLLLLFEATSCFRPMQTGLGFRVLSEEGEGEEEEDDEDGCRTEPIIVVLLLLMRLWRSNWGCSKC